MSSALLANLPRFDEGEQAHPADMLKRMLGQMQGQAKPPEPPAEDVSEEVVEAPPVDLGPSLEEVERLISDLSGLMTRLERDSREQSMHVIQALAARLFPELSRRFLADEIGEHLAGLVPASVPAVEIKARPPMLEKLEPIIARSPSLSGRCSLVPTETAEDAQVRVSWKTGGVTFDFEALLAACLAHLDPAQTLIEE